MPTEIFYSTLQVGQPFLFKYWGYLKQEKFVGFFPAIVSPREIPEFPPNLICWPKLHETKKTIIPWQTTAPWYGTMGVAIESFARLETYCGGRKGFVMRPTDRLLFFTSDSSRHQRVCFDKTSLRTKSRDTLTEYRLVLWLCLRFFPLNNSLTEVVFVSRVWCQSWLESKRDQKFCGIKRRLPAPTLVLYFCEHEAPRNDVFEVKTLGKLDNYVNATRTIVVCQ